MKFLNQKSCSQLKFIYLQIPKDDGDGDFNGDNGESQKWKFREKLREESLHLFSLLAGQTLTKGCPKAGGITQRTNKFPKKEPSASLQFLEDCAFYDNCLLAILRKINQWDISSDEPESLRMEKFLMAITEESDSYARLKFFIDQLLIFHNLGGHNISRQEFINTVAGIKEEDIGGTVLFRDGETEESMKDAFLMLFKRSKKFSAVEATILFAIWRTTIFDILETLKTHLKTDVFQ